MTGWMKRLTLSVGSRHRPPRVLLYTAAVIVVVGTGGVLAESAMGAASTFGNGIPAFVEYPAPSTLTDHDNAGEPSIGVNWNTNPAGGGTVMFQAFETTYRVAFNDATDPAGVTWADTAAPNVINVDPILATDHATGRSWAGGLATACGQMALSDSDGASWTPFVPCSGSIDHETIGSGPWAGTPPLLAYPRAVYYCAQSGLQAGNVGDMCAVSSNGGQTFGAPRPAGCGGLHGHVKISADGTAYLPNNDCDQSVGHVGGSVSRDNGSTWASYDLGQASPARGFDPSVATTPDNTVIQAWSANNSWHPMVAFSADHGSTWTKVTDLAGTVPGLAVSTFQAAVGGDNGRYAVAFLGSSVTPAAGQTPFDNGYDGIWNLYVAYTYDGGTTWTTVNATPSDPVQRGCIWDGGGSNTCRNLLDFIDASVTSTGRVVVAFADGCLSCTTSADSTHAWATIARQSAGKGLLQAFDS